MVTNQEKRGAVIIISGLAITVNLLVFIAAYLDKSIIPVIIIGMIDLAIALFFIIVVYAFKWFPESQDAPSYFSDYGDDD